MSGVVLTLLDQPETVPALLDAAARLAALAGDAAVHALVVRTPPEATILPSEEVLTDRRAAALRATEQQRAGALTQAFAAWPGHGRAQLADLEGVAADIVAERGAAADFIVAARPGSDPHGAGQPAIRAALFQTDRPVLLVPPGAPPAFGSTVAVAWRDDGHVVKAVLPLLRLLTAAAAVHVLEGVRDGPAARPVPAVFADHGIPAQMHVLPISDGVFGAALLEQAHALGADLLVMGAYGHNPLRELIFGGVTRFMLEHADLPVLMRH